MNTLALMLSLGGEPELIRPVAEVIDRVARTREERAALIADGWFESRFARYVIEGRCQDGPKGARCDPDKNGVPRARGVWQVWHYCKGQGTEAEARCVLSQMRLGLSRCGSWEGAFSALHGPGCGWSGARERVQLMRKLLAKP